jgi:hypothetical protein
MCVLYVDMRLPPRAGYLTLAKKKDERRGAGSRIGTNQRVWRQGLAVTRKRTVMGKPERQAEANTLLAHCGGHGIDHFKRETRSSPVSRRSRPSPPIPARSTAFRTAFSHSCTYSETSAFVSGRGEGRGGASTLMPPFSGHYLARQIGAQRRQGVVRFIFEDMQGGCKSNLILSLDHEH